MGVEVDEVIHEGLAEVLDNDELNEFHHTNTRKWLFLNDYYPAASWIRDNHLSYAQGLQHGFEAVEREERDRL